MNDAEANPGNGRGAHLVFDPNNGNVGLVDGLYSNDVFDIADGDPIGPLGPTYDLQYDPNLPAGSRYGYGPGDADYPGRSR